MTLLRNQLMAKVLMRELLGCIVLGLIFAFLGIYDTDSLAIGPRIVFWTTVMCLGAVLLSVVEPLVYGRLLKTFNPIFQIVLIAIIISVPITVFLASLNAGFSFQFSKESFSEQFVSVIIISLIISFGRYLVFQFLNRVNEIERKPEKPRESTAAFMERLPLKFRTASLYAVSSEGHYLRVHTDRGNPLILMRISDAIRELSVAKGLQVHRSWWVAHDGIADIKREKGRRMLILKNNEVTPVSRRHLPALKLANLDG